MACAVNFNEAQCKKCCDQQGYMLSNSDDSIVSMTCSTTSWSSTAPNRLKTTCRNGEGVRWRQDHLKPFVSLRSKRIRSRRPREPAEFWDRSVCRTVYRCSCCRRPSTCDQDPPWIFPGRDRRCFRSMPSELQVLRSTRSSFQFVVLDTKAQFIA